MKVKLNNEWVDVGDKAKLQVEEGFEVEVEFVNGVFAINLVKPEPLSIDYIQPL